MNRKNKRLNLEKQILSFILLLSVAFLFFNFASPFLTGFVIGGSFNQSDFDLGTYSNTEYQTDHVQLVSGSISGTYSSQIFDVGSGELGIWNNLSWNETLPSDLIFSVDNAADVWKSNNGQTWTLVKDDFNGEEGNDPEKLVIDSRNTLIIVEGDDDVWSSTDGEVWAKVNDDYNGEGQHVKAIAIDTNDRIVLIEGDEDVWSSLDLGSTWQKVNGSDFNEGNGNAKGMVAINTDFYVVDNAADVWKSTDGGVSWTLESDDFTGVDVNGADSMTVDSNSNLWIVNNQEIWKSTDYGVSWTRSNDNYNGPETQNAKVMTVDSLNNLYIIEGDEDVWKSTDSGITWSKVADNYNGGNGNAKGISSISFSTDITFEIRSCSSSDCSDNIFVGGLTDSPETLTVDNNRYFQYQSTFTSDTVLETPILYTLSIDYDLFIDYDSPVVTLENPVDNATVNQTSNQTNVTFTYSVTDYSTIANCSLLINSSVNKTESNIGKGISQIFISALELGTYTWNIECIDSVNNVGSSNSRTISVVQLVVGTGEEEEPKQEASGSSGGGGGSSSVVKAECEEKWTCNLWSVCENGAKRRTCIDENICGTTESAPEIYQRCETEEQEQGELVVETTEDIEELSGGNAFTGFFVNNLGTSLGNLSPPLILGALILIVTLSTWGISNFVKGKEKVTKRSRVRRKRK